MDYSKNGKKGAKKFWTKFYSDENFRKYIIEKRKQQKKDPIKSHNAAKIAAASRWKDHKKENTKNVKTEKYPKDTRENIILKYRLCAYLTGDGSLIIRTEKSRPKAVHSDIRFYPDDEGMLKSFLEAFTYLYKKEPKVYREEKFMRVQKSSKIICNDLLRFTKFGAMEWKIPEIKSNKRAKIEWLRAFFDCEAYVSKKAITIQSVNESGIKEIQKLLFYFSIKSKTYSYERKNKNWNKNYILTIAPKQERMKFLNKIGFNHSRKQAKLKMYLADVA